MLQVVGEHLVPLPLFDEGIRNFEHLGKRFRAVTGAGVDPCVAAVRQNDGEDHRVVRQDLARDRRHAVEHLGQVGRIDQFAQQLVEQFERCRSRPKFLGVPCLIGEALMRQRQCHMVRKAPGNGDIGELDTARGPATGSREWLRSVLAAEPALSATTANRAPTSWDGCDGSACRSSKISNSHGSTSRCRAFSGSAVWRGRFRCGRAGHRIRDDVFSIIGQEQDRDRVVRKNPAGDLRHAREHLAQIEDAGKRRERFVHDGKSPQAGQFCVGLFGRARGQRPQTERASAAWRSGRRSDDLCPVWQSMQSNRMTCRRSEPAGRAVSLEQTM